MHFVRYLVHYPSSSSSPSCSPPVFFLFAILFTTRLLPLRHLVHHPSSSSSPSCKTLSLQLAIRLIRMPTRLYFRNCLRRYLHVELFHSTPRWPCGVLDRRPTVVLFYARILSACIAFTVFLVSVSISTQPPFSPLSVARSRPYVHHLTYPPIRHPVSLTQFPLSALNATRFVAADATEIVFQRAQNPRGAILVLHGCSHSATHWFPPSLKCPQCIALPEELNITLTSLRRAYSVIAVSSTQRASKCWITHPEARLSPDYARIRSALQVAQTLAVYNASQTLLALGVSSGGIFASSLPLRFPVAAVHSIVSAAVVANWTPQFLRNHKTFVPHVFTHMARRDKRTAGAVHLSMARLAQMSVPSIEFTVLPRPITVNFLTQAMPNISLALAANVVSAMRAASHIDSAGHLTADPRLSSWRSAVQHLKAELSDSLIPDASPLSEELNRAWSVHEITSEHFSTALDFIENALAQSSLSVL